MTFASVIGAPPLFVKIPENCRLSPRKISVVSIPSNRLDFDGEEMNPSINTDAEVIAEFGGC